MNRLDKLEKRLSEIERKIKNVESRNKYFFEKLIRTKGVKNQLNLPKK